MDEHAASDLACQCELAHAQRLTPRKAPYSITIEGQRQSCRMATCSHHIALEEVHMQPCCTVAHMRHGRQADSMPEHGCHSTGLQAAAMQGMHDRSDICPQKQALRDVRL